MSQPSSCTVNKPVVLPSDDNLGTFPLEPKLDTLISSMLIGLNLPSKPFNVQPAGPITSEPAPVARSTTYGAPEIIYPSPAVPALATVVAATAPVEAVAVAVPVTTAVAAPIVAPVAAPEVTTAAPVITVAPETVAAVPAATSAVQETPTAAPVAPAETAAPAEIAAPAETTTAAPVIETFSNLSSGAIAGIVIGVVAGVVVIMVVGYKIRKRRMSS